MRKPHWLFLATPLGLLTVFMVAGSFLMLAGPFLPPRQANARLLATFTTAHDLYTTGVPGPQSVRSKSKTSPSPIQTCQPAWTKASSPITGGNTNYLSGVAVILPTDVWAVGQFSDGSAALTLVEHWNGREWGVVPSPNVAAFDNWLLGISVLSAEDIWAVGYVGSYNPSQTQTLTEHWDGVSWSIVPSPNTVTHFNWLNGAAAISRNDVWAVGYYENGTLTEHWDGSSWSIIPSPSGGATTSNNQLRKVTAISSDNIWAVGSYSSDVDGLDQTLIEHWNGSVWSVEPSPNVASYFNNLYDIAALSATDIWAVGSYGPYEGPDQTLVEHWNGSAWIIVPSPNVGTASTALLGVTALSANDAWAVGAYGGGSPYDRPVTEHWDGSAWALVPHPDMGTNESVLFAVGAAASLPALNNLWAVGYNEGSALAERYSDVSVDVQSSDYFYEAVRYLMCRGVVSGYVDNTFHPFNNTTRGQLCKIIVLAEGWTIYTPPTPTFSDVPASNPFYNFVETAYHQGIISGYSGGTFRPGNNVTRGQLCKIVVLAQQWQLQCSATGHFTDVPPSDPFFCYIETAYSHSITSGYADGTFRPGNSATRGQISKIVYQAITQP